uniref:Uncharacterized protein n=1 Tax=Pyrodinium bahamense TaxID=73915 RepID=A0A7S0BCF1_9DINO
MATEARWKHVVAGIKAGGYEDGDLPMLLREAARLGGRTLLDNLPASMGLMARAAMIEVVDALVEAGLCSLDSTSDIKELTAEPTSAPELFRGQAGGKGGGEEDRESGFCRALQAAADLLRTNSFLDMIQALDILDTCRREWLPGDLGEAKQLDRLEAEGLRQYAQCQAEAERYAFAIDGYLQKAIQLDPRRAELFTERARYRLQQACPWLPQDGEFPSEAARFEAQRALEDCEHALTLDASLEEAYELALPVLLARGDLAAAEQVAKRGQVAVRGTESAGRLACERRRAQAVRSALERAEQLLAAPERQPAEIERLVGQVIVAAGERSLEAPLRRRLEFVRHAAGTQRQFEEAYGDRAAKATFDDSWAQLFDPRHAARPRAAPTPLPPQSAPRSGPPASAHGGGSGATPAHVGSHGWGLPPRRRHSGTEWRGPEWPGTRGSQYQEGTGLALKPTSGDHCTRMKSGSLPVASEEEEFQLIIVGIQRCLDGQHGHEKHRMIRQLFLEWHPDKRLGEQGLATKVFQWLQTAKESLD